MQCAIGFLIVAGVFASACTSDSTSSPAGSTAPQASGEFCSFGEKFLDRGEAMTEAFDGNDPRLLQAATAGTTAQVDGMVAHAPAQIAADLAVVQATYKEFVAVLESGDYDLVALTGDPEAQAVIDSLDSPDVSNASTRVDTFLTQACGITTQS